MNINQALSKEGQRTPIRRVVTTSRRTSMLINARTCYPLFRSTDLALFYISVLELKHPIQTEVLLDNKEGSSPYHKLPESYR